MNATDRRGLVVGLVLVVAMAGGALALGLGGAFSDVPCSAPTRLTVHVGPAIPDRGQTANVYRLTPPELTPAQVAGFANALGVGSPVATPVGWRAGDRSRIGSLELVRYPDGWSVDAQPARHAPAPFARRTDHPGSRTTARRAALEVLAAFGVDARSWSVDVSQVEDSEWPAREVTLVQPLADLAPHDGALSDFEWTVEVWKDGSITSVQGTLTTATAIPTRLSAPREVLRSFARRDADPYRVEPLSMQIRGHGSRARVRVGRSTTFHIPRADRVTLRCTGVVASRWYSSVVEGREVSGAIASRPPARFDPGTDVDFRAEHVERAYLATVVAGPSADHAYLVPTYVFSGSTGLVVRDGKPYDYHVIELAVPAEPVVAGD